MHMIEISWTLWPSRLRRWLKAPFRKGVGPNPTGVIRGHDRHAHEGERVLSQYEQGISARPAQSAGRKALCFVVVGWSPTVGLCAVMNYCTFVLCMQEESVQPSSVGRAQGP